MEMPRKCGISSKCWWEICKTQDLNLVTFDEEWHDSNTRVMEHNTKTLESKKWLLYTKLVSGYLIYKVHLLSIP